MLKLEHWKVVFVAAGLVGVLLFASPTLTLVLHYPAGERFSELYVLGSGQMAEGYPSQVNASGSYLVYLGIGNHVGASAYYVVYVKFANQTDALPNSTLATPSPLPPLYEYRVFLQDNENWSAPLDFSLSNVSFSGNVSAVETLKMNNVTFNVSSMALRNVESGGHYFWLIAELWIYDPASGTIYYDNRYVDLVLNLKR